MAAGLDSPFHDRIHPRHPDTAEHDRDRGIGEDRVEQCWVLPIPFTDQVLDLESGVVEVHEQVPGRLGHLRRARMGGGAEDMYPGGWRVR
jgi:hypothetical protein